MDTLDITTIILTFNEELHIKRCINNAFRFSKEVFLIDSFSSDKTCEIAKEMGAKVLQNKWSNYATQLNWGLTNAPIKTEWVMRLDADEYLEDDLIEDLKKNLVKEPKEITGIEFRRKVFFLDKWMKHASPTVYLLRLFRFGKGVCEMRMMDEHIILSEGQSKKYNGYFVDYNLFNISWWAKKHVGYSEREAADLLNIEYELFSTSNNGHLEGQAGNKRKLKNKYAHKALFFRSFAYFIYRYFFKLGFLDGKKGFLWCFMQAWWYRTLVDIQVYQIKNECGDDKKKIKDYLKNKFGIRM